MKKQSKTIENDFIHYFIPDISRSDIEITDKETGEMVELNGRACLMYFINRRDFGEGFKTFEDVPDFYFDAIAANGLLKIEKEDADRYYRKSAELVGSGDKKKIRDIAGKIAIFNEFQLHEKYKPFEYDKSVITN